MSRRIAVADIGGTHARFALAEIDGGKCLSLTEPVTLGTNDHASFQTAWAAFGKQIEGELPDAISIALERNLSLNVQRYVTQEADLGVDAKPGSDEVGHLGDHEHGNDQWTGMVQQ